MDYIIPTKNEPIFQAECDHFGFIEDGFYKYAKVGNGITSVFALTYSEAINKLHEYLQKDNYGKEIIEEYPKAKFSIYEVDGRTGSNDETLSKTVYTLTASKIKKYF